MATEWDHETFTGTEPEFRDFKPVSRAACDCLFGVSVSVLAGVSLNVLTAFSQWPTVTEAIIGGVSLVCMAIGSGVKEEFLQ